VAMIAPATPMNRALVAKVIIFSGGHVDADMGGRLLVFADALQGLAELGDFQKIDGEHQHRENKQHEVENAVVADGRYHPAGGAGYVHLPPKNEMHEKLDQAESEHDKIDAPQPEGQGAHQGGQAKAGQPPMTKTTGRGNLVPNTAEV
jgi:hypothetical protein